MNNLFKDLNVKRGFAAARINFKSLIMVFAIIFASFVVMDLPGIIMSAAGGNVEGLGFSSLIYFFALVIPILLATSNFHKTMRLGAKKKDYFVGMLIFLSLLAAAVSIISIALYYGVDKLLSENVAEMYSLFNVLGFAANGIAIGFLQQFGLLFFFSVIVFMIANIQDTWKGWLADMLIVLLCVLTFTIDDIRDTVGRGIIYALVTGHPAAQICITVFCGLALYSLYLVILKSKKI